jgi:hypothetical protein
MTGAVDASGRPTARPAVRRANNAALLIVVLVSLSVAWAGMGTIPYRIAAAPVRTDAINLARLDGVLAAQANMDGTACFWVGEGPNRIALSWPWGYTARGSPLAPALGLAHLAPVSRLAVYDESGRRVVLVGQRVSMAGGLAGVAVRSILGCSGFHEYWGVGKVVTAA